MVLGLRPRQLCLAAKSENIVPKNVFLPIILMEILGAAPINRVVFQSNSGAAFIGVKTPATVSKRIYVVNQIVAQNRSGLSSQSINASHVAEHFLANIMQVIEFNNVCSGWRRIVAPRP